MKAVINVQNGPGLHWVGDGFPVQSLFGYDTHGAELSPFLLLDHAAPRDFAPSAKARGVGQHPHRGFETVTIVYSGELAHRDSTGAGGTIGTGDVQWMTASAGIIHEEFHSAAFTRDGGTLEMVQLWVNLPARHKMSPPSYQTLLSNEIPVVGLTDDAGTVRVIAGAFEGVQGPAKTFTQMNVWDISLRPEHQARFHIAAGDTLAVVVLRGSILVNTLTRASQGQLVTFEREGEAVVFEALDDAKVLLLSGEPIDEPIVGYGPFVMNSEREISEAITDFNAGRFGRMAS